MLVRRLAHQARQLSDFIVGCIAAGAEEHADGPLREFPLQAIDQRKRGVVAVAHAEEQLVLGIVLPAEAGEVLVGVRIEAADGFQDAYWRGETGVGLAAGRAPEKPPAAKQDDTVVDEWDGGHSQEYEGSERHGVFSGRL